VLHERLNAASRRLMGNPGTIIAAKAVERLAAGRLARYV
jgi:hypothetical protein